MKKYILTLILFSLTFIAYCQVPQGMSYQAVAYNNSGAIVTTPISLRISILETATGTPIYTETHSTTPNLQGVYSLNIGQGTTVTGTFSTINWGNNTKFLKVEMDVANGTNYTLVGTNQLMSVPYALYSQNSNSSNSIVTVKNIYDLRNFQDFNPDIDDATIYVQGYNSPSDGGGGTFIFKNYNRMFWNNTTINYQNYTPSEPYEDGGIYIDSNNETIKGKGIWIRQFNGEIDVRFYGAFGHSEDCTQKIQSAIDYAALSVGDVTDRKYGANKSNIVFIPNGSYKVRQLMLKKGITIKGSSKLNTSIGPSTDDDEPLIIIDKSWVSDVHISDISFTGSNGINIPNGHKSCFYISAQQKDSKDGAGLWDSSFKNINITRFKGTSMYFEGGTGATSINYKRVNQFIVFEGVYVESVGDLKQDNNYHALQIVGLNAQFSFNNCRFDGGPHLFGASDHVPTYTVKGRNVYIGVFKEGDFAAPTNINFNTCTFQHGIIGIDIVSADNINIFGCWFENFERAITVNGGIKESKSINIMNSAFGRSAGQFGDNNIYKNTGAVIVYAKAQINVLNNLHNNYGIGNERTHFIRLETNQSSGEFYENLGANTFGNSFAKGAQEDSEIRYSSGIGKTIDVNLIPTSEIKTENAKLVYLLNNSGNTKKVDEITSLISAGELICIRSDMGLINFKETKNISLGNMLDPITGNQGELTLNIGGIAIFVKSDDGQYRETYNLISYKNRE